MNNAKTEEEKRETIEVPVKSGSSLGNPYVVLKMRKE